MDSFTNTAHILKSTIIQMQCTRRANVKWRRLDESYFHFNKHETSSVVASDLRADEVGKDGHVSEVGFDDLGLDSLQIGAGFDGFLNFLQEVSVRALQSTLEATAHARRE